MQVRTTRELMQDVVENLPPDATVEEAMERLYLLAKIEHGLEQAGVGETLTHEEVRHRLGI